MRIRVLGDGVAAHLAALMLARAGLEVTRTPARTGDHGLGPVGHAVLGLPDWQAGDVAAAIGWVPGSAFALGIGFAGWSAAPWFWPFGDIGAPLEGVAFPQVVARLRAAGHDIALADHALAALAARAERFQSPSPDPRSPLASIAVGVHYPVEALAARLTTLAEAAGVRVSDAPADLTVDASGNAAPDGWESWREWLPCNRAEPRIAAADRAPPPYPIHTADPDGWRATVALDGALCDTRYSIDGPGAPYHNGVSRAAWSGDRVAIGAAAGVVEPVLGTALLLAHDAVARLIALLPHDPANTRAEAAEYNRLTVAQHEGARDAAVALWATRAEGGRAATPPALARKLGLYRSRGRLSLEEDEPFDRIAWTALLDGQGVRQRRVDPIAAAIPVEAALAHCARIRDRFATTVAAMPRHADALARLKDQR